jgi:hypothetical protein
MERIAKNVCPVDLSKGSRNAVAHAATLARLHHVELHLLHVSGGGEPKSPGGAECTRSVGLGPSATRARLSRWRWLAPSWL